MIRFFAPALVVLLAGCCHQPGATTLNNPFNYHSRIAAPPTGTAVPGAAAPYVPPAAGNSAPQFQPAPAIQGSTASQPTAALAKVETRTSADTSGTGFREARSSVSARATEPSATRLASHTERSSASPAQPSREVKPSKPSPPTLASTATGSSRTFVASRPRDIATRPPADRPAAKVTSTGPRRSVGESRTNFGYKSDYSKLQGRLEYSASAEQWKLRYIPIDGKTDRFGGSVVLVENDRLTDFENGDFVTIDGELGRDGQDTVGFAPAYHLDSIRRL